jgi:acyl carrier protein
LLGAIGFAAKAIADRALTAKSNTEKKKRLSAATGDYSLMVPQSWKEIPEANPQAGIIAGHLLREQYVLVIRNPKEDFSGTLDEFDDLTTKSLCDGMTDAETSGPESKIVAGYPARLSRIKGTVDKIGISYLAVSLEAADAYYQVYGWTLKSREPIAFPVIEEIFESFKAQAGPPDPTQPGEKPESSETTRQDQPDQTNPKNPEDTLARVTALTAELLGINASEINPDHRFIEDLGADSLDTVELVMAVEEEFNITIADEKASELNTIRTLVDWIKLQNHAK